MDFNVRSRDFKANFNIIDELNKLCSGSMRHGFCMFFKTSVYNLDFVSLLPLPMLGV